MIADWMRYLVWVISAVGVVIWIRFALIYPAFRLHAVSPILWLLNVWAFQTARIFLYPGCLSVEALNFWSFTTQLHGVLMITGVGIIALVYKNAFFWMGR